MKQNKPYDIFAGFYDEMLEGVNYDLWYDYIVSVMNRYVQKSKCVLELGCGTGIFGKKFSGKGCRYYGMDLSLAMLGKAKAKTGKNFHVFCGNITDFALRKNMDFIFSVHDTMNYMFTKYDFIKALRCVRSALADNGVFMFDLATPYNIETRFMNKKLTYKGEDICIEWTNVYTKSKGYFVSTLRFLYPDGTYDEEIHRQRLYSVDEVKAMIEKVGLKLIRIDGDYGIVPYDGETRMRNFITMRT